MSPPISDHSQVRLLLPPLSYMMIYYILRYIRPGSSVFWHFCINFVKWKEARLICLMLIFSFGETFKLFFFYSIQCHIAFDDNALDLHLGAKVASYVHTIVQLYMYVYKYMHMYTYLIFVIFFSRAKFWRIKFTPKNTNFPR